MNPVLAHLLEARGFANIIDFEHLDPRVRELLRRPHLAGMASTMDLATLVQSCPAFEGADRDETARLLMLAMATPGELAMPLRRRAELSERHIGDRARAVAILLCALYRDLLDIEALGRGLAGLPLPLLGQELPPAEYARVERVVLGSLQVGVNAP